MNQTVIGVFDSWADAQTAVNALELQGFARSAIQITDDTTAGTVGTTTSDEPGFLARVGNFFGKLFGSDEDRVGHYAEAVRCGGCLVRVDVDGDADSERAVRALESAGAVDIDERMEQWRAQGSYGATSSEAASASPGMYTATRTPADSQTDAIPVVQESLEVGKRTVSQGAVRVYARTVEEPVSESVELREERARVERRPVDRPATEADLAAFTDRTIEVAETAEKAVVSKTARVVEEVVVGKETMQRTETVSDTVRHTEVEVERVDAPASTSDDSRWRTDYQSRYASLGGSYDDYAPAYRYGGSLAADQRYRGRDWDAIEADARRDWESRSSGGSTWERVKEAVRQAWRDATGPA